jgi:hypothetical protein
MNGLNCKAAEVRVLLETGCVEQRDGAWCWVMKWRKI